MALERHPRRLRPLHDRRQPGHGPHLRAPSKHPRAHRHGDRDRRARGRPAGRDRRPAARQQGRPRADRGLGRWVCCAPVLDGPDAHPHFLGHARAARIAMAALERRLQRLPGRRPPRPRPAPHPARDRALLLLHVDLVEVYPLEHARGPVPGLHTHGPGQGYERAPRRLSPRPAQRPHPADHTDRSRVARPGQRRPGRRGRVRLAGHRQARLRTGAAVRLHDGHGGHLLRHLARHRRQPPRRPPVWGARPTDQVRMIGPSRVAELEMPAAGIETGAARPAQSYWNESWERLRGNRLGVAAGLLIVVLALVAVMAPLLSAVLTHAQPQTIDLDSTFARPGAGGHLLGADELGRDTLTRLIWGARDSRPMLRHLLPNVLPVLSVAASLGVGQIILVEAALDFLGLGIQPPTPSWGNMLTNAQSYFFRSGSLVAFPGITIFITVLASNIFGNAVRDAFDPRLKS